MCHQPPWGSPHPGQPCPRARSRALLCRAGRCGVPALPPAVPGQRRASPAGSAAPALAAAPPAAPAPRRPRAPPAPPPAPGPARGCCRGPPRPAGDLRAQGRAHGWQGRLSTARGAPGLALPTPSVTQRRAVTPTGHPPWAAHATAAASPARQPHSPSSTQAVPRAVHHCVPPVPRWWQRVASPPRDGCSGACGSPCDTC